MFTVLPNVFIHSLNTRMIAQNDCSAQHLLLYPHGLPPSKPTTAFEENGFSKDDNMNIPSELSTVSS